MIFQINAGNFAETLILPVNPPDYKLTGGGRSFNDFTVLGGGEATGFGDLTLKELVFSSFFPRDYDASYCAVTNIPDPWDAVSRIMRWRDADQPVRVIISGTIINMMATIRQFFPYEKGGAPGDIYYDIAFKEYRYLGGGARAITVFPSSVSAVAAAAPRPDMQQSAKTYTVQSGDSLWAIAKSIYGSGADYQKIYEANKNTIGSNPNLIKPGQTFTIP